MFDVVTVPDFSGSRARAFEARTLLFLASWLENAGPARTFPLHVAGIGEAPASVRWLADRCGARVTTHLPLGGGIGLSANKLRGLEVDGRTDRVLLLDNDVLVLSDPSGLAELGASLSAAPAIVPRVPEAYWRRIYPALGLDLPDERIASVMHTLSCSRYSRTATPEQASEAGAMLPYFNSGVLLAPWKTELRALWESDMRRIATLFTAADSAWKPISQSDQTGLATAIHRLRSHGVPFRPLPSAFNASWMNLYRRAPGVPETKLFHAVFLYGRTDSSTRFVGGELLRYELNLVHQLLRTWRGDHLQAGSARRFLAPAVAQAHTLCAGLRTLYDRHVAPALARR
jgi:hypothetical protein